MPCPIGRHGLPLRAEGSAYEPLQAALRRHINKSRREAPLARLWGGDGKGERLPQRHPCLEPPPHPQPALPCLLLAPFQPSWPRPFLTRPSLSSPASLASPPFPGPSHPLASLTGRLPAATAPGSEAAVKGRAAWQGRRLALPTPGLACRPPVGPLYRRPALLYNRPGPGVGEGNQRPRDRQAAA